MSDEDEKIGVVEKIETDETSANVQEKIIGPDFGQIIEALGPITEGWFENQEKDRYHKLKMLQEQNAHNEKVLEAHKTVFSWQFWTVSGFLAAILLSGLYLMVFQESKSDDGMLIVSHFAFGIFGVIAGFGIKSASKTN